MRWLRRQHGWLWAGACIHIKRTARSCGCCGVLTCCAPRREQHELGVSGVLSDRFSALKHKPILVFSCKSLWQEAFDGNKPQPLAAKSSLIICLHTCYSTVWPHRAVLLIIFVKINASQRVKYLWIYGPNQSPECGGGTAAQKDSRRGWLDSNQPGQSQHFIWNKQGARIYLIF